MDNNKLYKIIVIVLFCLIVGYFAAGFVKSLVFGDQKVVVNVVSSSATSSKSTVSKTSSSSSAVSSSSNSSELSVTSSSTNSSNSSTSSTKSSSTSSTNSSVSKTSSSSTSTTSVTTASGGNVNVYFYKKDTNALTAVARQTSETDPLDIEIYTVTQLINGPRVAASEDTTYSKIWNLTGESMNCPGNDWWFMYGKNGTTATITLCKKLTIDSADHAKKLQESAEKTMAQFGITKVIVMGVNGYCAFTGDNTCK